MIRVIPTPDEEWDEQIFNMACTFYNPYLKENVHLKDLNGPFEIWNRIYSNSGLVEQEYLAAQVVDFATLEAYCKARNRYPLDAHIRHGRFNVNVIALWE